MSPELVLLVDFVVAVALLAVAAGRRLVQRLARRSAAFAALPALNAIVLTAYVFGEDSYRGNGISRWDAYRSPGGALGPMFVLSVALLAGCAGCSSSLVSAVGKASSGWPRSPEGSCPSASSLPRSSVSA